MYRKRITFLVASLLPCLLLVAGCNSAAQGRRFSSHGAHGSLIRSVAISPDGALAAVGYIDGYLELWDIPSGTMQKTLGDNEDEFDWIHSVCFDSTGTLLASSSRDESIKIWNVPAATESRTLQGQGEVGAMAFKPNSGILLVSCYPATVESWEVPTGLMSIISSPGGDSIGLGFSPDDELAAFAVEDESRNKRLLVLNLNTSATVFDVPIDPRILQIAISPDKRHLMTGDRAGILAFGTCKQTNRPLSSWPDTRPGLAVAFSPDGKLGASVNMDENVMVWDIAANTMVRKFIDSSVTSNLAFSPDGRHVMAGDKDGTVRYWDL